MAMHERASALHLALRNEPSATSRLRAAVDRLGLDLGLSEAERFDLKLAATEAVTNALKDKDDEEVRVTIAPAPDAVRIEVHDPRVADVPWPLAGVRADLESEGGRGLPLMLAVVDDVQLACARDGTHVRMTKRLAPRAA